MKIILARKIGMTRIFQDDGTVVPVTILRAGPAMVTQAHPVNSKEMSVQLGFEETVPKHLSRPQQGHLKGLPPFRTLQSFRLPAGDRMPSRGEHVTVSTFATGDQVKVAGISKGKGFTGVMKRHGFHGGPASHGTKHTKRAPGSIGTRFPQLVVKGRRMAGRAGGERVTVRRLTVVDVVPEDNLLIVKGAVPGARGALLEVRAEGA